MVLFLLVTLIPLSLDRWRNSSSKHALQNMHYSNNITIISEVSDFLTHMCNIEFARQTSKIVMWGMDTLKAGTMNDTVHHAYRDIFLAGREVWNNSTLREVLALKYLGMASVNDLEKLPPYQEAMYDMSASETVTNLPPVFVANNPNNLALVARMKDRLAWIGIQPFQFITLDKEYCLKHMDWIENHVTSTYFKNNTDRLAGHVFATLTAYRFVQLLSNLDVAQHAVYLETDATPIHGLRRKLASFYRQLLQVNPGFDLAYLGTCLGLEKLVTPVERLSANVYRAPSHPPQVRCTNAIMMSKAGAQKVMAYGPSNAPRFGIDLMFTHMINEIPLNTVWANEPLFYEENKIPRTRQLTC
jgi:hypothetical protein